MIPHDILDTDLHMDYNSVFHTEEIDLSRARTPNLEIERIVSLSHAYAPSLSNTAWAGPLVVDPVMIIISFLVSLIPKFSKGAFQQVAAIASAHVEIPDTVLDIDDSVLLSTGSILETIKLKQAANKPFRFNIERCSRLFADDPNYPILSYTN